MISVVGKEWVVASTHLALLKPGRSSEPWREGVVQLTGLAKRQSTVRASATDTGTWSGHEACGQKATMSVKDRAQVRSVQPDLAHRGAG